jgi:sulfur carrier protein ThiS
MEGSGMTVTINQKKHDFPPGTKFAKVVQIIREANKDEPVTKSLLQKTGKDYLTFILNHRLVRPQEYDSIELKEGDEIRWIYPYAGG